MTCYFCREPQFFYIRNQGNQRVLETVSTGEDWRCRLSPKKPLLDDAQLWYEDTNGLIRSRVECLYLAAAGKHSTPGWWIFVTRSVCLLRWI